MTKLFKLPRPSSGQDGDGPTLTEHAGREYSIACTWDDIRVRLVFSDVRVVNCRHYGAISLSMIDAYDHVVEYESSQLLTDTRQLIGRMMDAGQYRHLAICFDDGPYYEFICKGFSAS